MITTIVSAFGVSGILGIALKYYFEHIKLKNETFSKTASDLLNKEILKPFYSSIELALYKLVIPKQQEKIDENQVTLDVILPTLKNLKKKIYSNSLLFSFIDDLFLYNLSQTIISMEKQSLNFKDINNNFTRFSKTYFELLNKVRKAKFLPPRGEFYRITFHLYSQKSAKKFQNNLSRTVVFKLIALALCISFGGVILTVSLMHFVVSTNHLISDLYKLMN